MRAQALGNFHEPTGGGDLATRRPCCCGCPAPSNTKYSPNEKLRRREGDGAVHAGCRPRCLHPGVNVREQARATDGVHKRLEQLPALRTFRLGTRPLHYPRCEDDLFGHRGRVRFPGTPAGCAFRPIRLHPSFMVSKPVGLFRRRTGSGGAPLGRGSSAPYVNSRVRDPAAWSRRSLRHPLFYSGPRGLVIPAGRLLARGCCGALGSPRSTQTRGHGSLRSRRGQRAVPAHRNVAGLELRGNWLDHVAVGREGFTAVTLRDAGPGC